MLAEYWGYGHHSEQFVAHYLQLILMESLRVYEDKQRKILNRYKFKYTEVLDYIDSHYQQLKLAELANVFGYNSNYLSNMLKKYTGKNFQEILLEKRLLLASDLLIHSDHTIDHIAEESGFNSVNYFFKQFKKRYHCTPNQYRKQNR
ncbi:helix-turn-helix domain-containing protein [Streptococcus merionis]|uniref:AraC family transcriptional regulator n=1 Tax=Streptococcus merionis TaxID=400065 RepID=A0A239SW50_9STRE|nr:AraC family transcriptional regulator [Streptococcus merionis]SNU89068.1 AraC family transcriptional regulator [Streptococcus merionis]